LASQAINSSLIDFCQQTMLYQSLDTQDVTATKQEYRVALPPNSKLIKILGVWHISDWLPPVSVEAVRSGVALRGAVVTSTNTVSPLASTPRNYFQKSPTDTTLQLYPIPVDTIVKGLLVRAAFRPTRTATTVDDEIFNEWVEVIAAGALQRLFAMPAQPFYNAKAAADYARVFSDGCRAAEIKARMGAAATSSFVRFRPFA
jgi:hypothetical protein